MGAAASIGTNVLAARLLAPDDLGAYFLVASIVAFAMAVGRLGLNRVATRLVASHLAADEPGSARASLARIVFLACCSSAAVGASLAFGGGHWLGATVFGSSAAGGVAALVALWTIAESLRSVVSDAFRGFHEVAYAAVCGDPGRYAATAVAMGVMVVVLGRASLPTVVGASTAAVLALAVIGSVALGRRVRSLGPTRERIPAGAILVIALPLLVVDLAGIVMNNAPLWVIGASASPRDAAVVGAVVRIVTVLTIPLTVVNVVVAPTVAHLHAQHRRRDMQRLLRSATTVASVPMFAVGALLVAFGGPVLALMFGSFARPGATVLAVLVIGQAVTVATGSCGIALAMTGHERSAMVIMAVATAATLVVAVLVRGAGVTAVAAVCAAGLSLQNVVMTWQAKRVLGIWTHLSLAPRAFRRFLRFRL